MNTFLPYSSFAHSVAVLDTARLNKQRLECQQILTSLKANARRAGAPPLAGWEAEKRVGWVNHPAVRMWRGHEAALGVYCTLAIAEWERRGHLNTMVAPYREDWSPEPLHHCAEFMAPLGAVRVPGWLGREDVHASHRARLLHKVPEHYGPLGWTETPRDDAAGCVWPV